MKTHLVSLRAAGIICFMFMLFHFAFNTLFDWKNTLACLSQSDRAILLTYHYISILILGFMTYVMLFQTRALLNSPLKYSVLGFFILFFTIRIITEFTHFGFTGFPSIIILTMCSLPIILWSIPIFQKKHENKKTI